MATKHTGDVNKYSQQFRGVNWCLLIEFSHCATLRLPNSVTWCYYSW